MSTVGLIASGLLSFFYTFFAQTYPKTESKIEILSEKINSWDNFHKEVRDDLKEIRSAQKEFYILLLERKNPRDK